MLEVADSALKHGIAEEDSRHAWRNVLRFGEEDYDGEARIIAVGPARNGALLELVLVPRRWTHQDHPCRSRPPLAPGPPEVMTMLKTTVHDEATATEEWLDSIDPAQIEFRDASHIRAIMVAKAARDEADARLGQAVAAARAGGDSWTAIGAALGVSKQAAQQRYGEAPREQIAQAIVEAFMADAGHALDVVPQGSRCWGIKVQGGRAVDIAGTQQAAIATARDVVRNHGGGDVVVHGRDGKVRQVIRVKEVASPHA